MKIVAYLKSAWGAGSWTVVKPGKIARASTVVTN